MRVGTLLTTNVRTNDMEPAFHGAEIGATRQRHFAPQTTPRF